MYSLLRKRCSLSSGNGCSVCSGKGVHFTPFSGVQFDRNFHLSMLAWDGNAGASLFLNSSGLTIPVDYFLGSVRIFKEVFFTLGPGRELCQGDDLELAPMLWSSNGEVSYLWNGPAGLSSTPDTLWVNDIQPDQSGTYALRLTDTLGCHADDSLEVTVYPAPVPAFAGQDTIITGSPVEIDAGQGFASYLWSNGQASRYITAAQEGWYRVSIESMQGCTAVDSVYVRFIAPPPEPQSGLIFLPNAFSPDGDGLNDAFRAITSSDNIASFQMYIYNRWGILVFESHDITRGWDGTYKGKQAPAGTYVYRVDYAVSDQDFNITGTVVLVK